METPFTPYPDTRFDSVLDGYERAWAWTRQRPSWQFLPLSVGLALAPFAVAGATLVGLWWLLTTVLDLLAAGAGWLGHSAAAAAVDVWHSAPVGLFVDPIGHWLDVHAAGLAVSADVLALGWGIGGAILFGLAVLTAARGAQLGWLGYGGATAAMAYAGAAPTHAPIVAGAVGLAWALGSVLALRRVLPHRL